MVTIDDNGQTHDARGRFGFMMKGRGNDGTLFKNDENDQWRDNGYDDMDVGDLTRAGLTLEDANKWRAHFFDVRDTVSWHGAGFTPEEAHEWVSSGPVNRPSDAEMLRDAGLSVEEGSEWVKAVPSKKNDSMARVALEWRKAGFTLEETSKWARTRLDSESAVHLRRVGMTVEEAGQWRDALLGYPKSTDILKWSVAGFTHEEAEQWSLLAVSRTSEDASKLRDAGLTPNEARKYVNIGIYHADEVIRLRNTGANIDQLRAEHYKKSLRDASRSLSHR
jgi:hypothetical protein